MRVRFSTFVYEQLYVIDCMFLSNFFRITLNEMRTHLLCVVTVRFFARKIQNIKKKLEIKSMQKLNKSKTSSSTFNILWAILWVFVCVFCLNGNKRKRALKKHNNIGIHIVYPDQIKKPVEIIYQK